LEVVVKLSKSIAAAAAAFVAVSAAGASRAAVVEWTLQGVHLSDGTAVTGTFDYDVDSNQYSNVDIVVASGPSYPVATTFTVPIFVGEFSTSLRLNVLPNTYGGGDATGFEEFYFAYDTPLSDAGGTIGISNAPGTFSPQLWVCGDSTCLTGDVSEPFLEGGDHPGFVTTDASPGVPEPAAWALMLMGFGGLGAMLRRRRAVPA
jgi:hypothetical protein